MLSGKTVSGAERESAQTKRWGSKVSSLTAASARHLLDLLLELRHRKALNLRRQPAAKKAHARNQFAPRECSPGRRRGRDANEPAVCGKRCALHRVLMRVQGESPHRRD
eukprot:180127-Prymnesium_polylepis.1